MKKWMVAICALALLAGCAPAASPAVSESPAPVESAVPAATLKDRLAELTAEEIGCVSWYGADPLPTEDTVAELVSAAARDHVSEPGTYDEMTLNGSDTDVVWILDFYLASKDQECYFGADGVYIQAGLQEGLVRIFGGENLPRGEVYVRDEALYELVRTSLDREDYINETWYERCREMVDGYYDARLEELRESGFVSWELTEFAGILGTTKEDGKGAVAFRMGAAFRTDPPELAPQCIAGGAYVDSQLRVHGLDWQSTYLVTIDGEPVGIAFGDEILEVIEDCWGAEDLTPVREAVADSHRGG